MKKLLFVSLAMVFVFAMFIPQATAVQEEKVAVCHVIAANVVISFGPVKLYFGKEIQVAESALEAHLAHGDFDSFWGANTEPDSSTGPINAFREAGAKLPAANCYFGELADGTLYGPPE